MNVLLTPDGLRLHLQRWPATGPAHGTVQIVHGLGEHVGRYAALAAWLNERGWNVVGHDHRGHGRSEGPRGGTPDRELLLMDLSAALDHLRIGRGPHVLLGHSMGGLLAARFVAESLAHEARRWARDVDGLVLSSPAFELGLGRGRRALLALLARVTPGLRLGNGLRPEWICSDPEVVRRYLQDPLVHDRITPRLARLLLHEAGVVFGRAARWRTPTLLMWAGADRCVVPAGSAAFARLVPPAMMQAQEFPALAHEIFNEPGAEAVRARLGGWLRRFEVAPYTAARRA